MPHPAMTVRLPTLHEAEAEAEDAELEAKVLAVVDAVLEHGSPRGSPREEETISTPSWMTAAMKHGDSPYKDTLLPAPSNETLEGLDIASTRRRAEKVKTGTKSEYSVFGVPVAQQALEAARKRALVEVVFEDDRWDKALQHLSQLEGWGPTMAQALLREGAAVFGFWELSAEALAGLTHQLLGQAEGQVPSAPIAEWLRSRAQSQTQGQWKKRKTIEWAGHRQPKSPRSVRSRPEATVSAKLLQTVRAEAEESGWATSMWNGNDVKLGKFALGLFIFLAGNAYALEVVKYMYPQVIEILGWPVYFARAAGMSAALFTGFLYLTMSRTLLTKLSRCVDRFPRLVACLDAHKDIHVFCAKGMLLAAAVHIIGHILSTIPSLLSQPLDRINSLLGCANPGTTPGLMRFMPLGFMHWPKCPLEQKPKDPVDALLTTLPGLTGLLLVAVLLITWSTGRSENRKTHFDVFWYVHNFTILVWPLLLFAHGANCWIGVGVPLVLLTSSLPILAFLVDRICRALRYCLFAGGAVKIVQATVRPGKKGNADGALSYIKVSRPPFLWDFRPGMYAFVCIPEIAPLQWHPFTICSGPRDETVDFLIAGIGDWTRELANRCMAASAGGLAFPKIALDGPYAAPTQSAAAKRVLIAVGAGVGITPFLSLLSSLIDNLEDDHQQAKSLLEAHFFWTTRSADEYFFGRQLLAKIGGNPHLRDRMFLHLHVTSSVPDKDPAPFLFREALRRQSQVDQAAFREAMVNAPMLDLQELPIQVPWCWINGSFRDVVWVRHLLEDEEGDACVKSKNLWLRQLSKMSSLGSSNRMSRSSCSEMEVAVSSASDALPKACSGPGAGAQQQQSRQSSAEKKAAAQLMPISLGRPDFLTEIDAIGSARPDVDVDIYACCNAVLVKDLRDIATVCNRNAQMHAIKGRRPQHYAFHYERFG